jgi:DNA-binding PadR family transcriptional regulator
VLETLSAPLFIDIGARFAQLIDALPHISRSGMYKILNRLMSPTLGYIRQGKTGEPYSITEAGMAALSLGKNTTIKAESTESTLSPLPSGETRSLPSTVSTRPVGCGRGGLGTPDPDEKMQAEAVQPTPEVVALTAVERHCLTLVGEQTRTCPREFVAVQQLLTSQNGGDDTLHQLLDKGYLERQYPNNNRYRLTTAGWAALGLRIVQIDLSKF